MGVEFEQLTEAQKEAVVLEINSRLKPWAENVSAASLLMVGLAVRQGEEEAVKMMESCLLSFVGMLFAKGIVVLREETK